MVTQTINLNMVPGAVCPVIHLNQYDKDADSLKFNLYDNSGSFSIPSSSAIVLNGTKPDGYGFSYSATYSGNEVTASVDEQMTAVAGEVKCELRITKSGNVVGTQNFILMVEPAALDENTVISDSDIPAIAAAADYAAEAASSAAEAASTLSSTVKKSDIVNNSTYTGATGEKVLDASMGKTLKDATDGKVSKSGDTMTGDLVFASDSGVSFLNRTRIYDSASSTSGAFYILSSPNFTNQSQFLFGTNGRLAVRTRTRESTSSDWGEWSAYSYIN